MRSRAERGKVLRITQLGGAESMVAMAAWLTGSRCMGRDTKAKSSTCNRINSRTKARGPIRESTLAIVTF